MNYISFDDILSHHLLENELEESLIEATYDCYESMYRLRSQVKKKLMSIVQKKDWNQIRVIDGFNRACILRSRMLKFDFKWKEHSAFECWNNNCKCETVHIMKKDFRNRPNDLHLLVFKERGKTLEQLKTWYRDIEELSTEPNAVLFFMSFNPKEYYISHNHRRSYYDRIQSPIRPIQRIITEKQDHDDLGVLILEKIVKENFDHKCYRVTEDKYRNLNEMIETIPPFWFNIIKDKRVIYDHAIHPRDI